MPKMPVPMRVAMNLLLYISKAGGPGELGQALTIMREADPMAAAACENLVRSMRASGMDI